MDTFVNLAKQGYSAYEKSQENVSKTGGSEYNRPSHSQHDPGRPDSPDLDEDYAVKHATQHGSGDESLFSSAMSFVKSNSGSKHEPVDEEGVTSAHQKVYEHGSGSSMSADSLGSAAALQAFKKFTSSGGSENKEKDSKSTLISMAMAEASQLFDKSGGTASGGKQDAVNSAGMTVMKLLVQSKFSSMTGGGNSGGLGGLLSMASKFA
ncbi:uncharacterized protein FOMMEDRAFT_120741 [Fomitiporia mediterranea MF3/22]|uniref:uncharacterized protein n=1 Tax=Fomitiporia mediterranea (strain MF3/22) TaxID=694068 RepID=UPI0004409246|nr:uncharacterized protein FOMMEDRAFT_120741 [Fomitiporia mediterranea MF3/22]EJD03593.1 hypothetical protein FOMMEDRAFT_120741 [Fomitiporia mediterranea MF3/22]